MAGERAVANLDGRSRLDVGREPHDVARERRHELGAERELFPPCDRRGENHSVGGGDAERARADRRRGAAVQQRVGGSQAAPEIPLRTARRLGRDHGFRQTPAVLVGDRGGDFRPSKVESSDDPSQEIGNYPIL